MRMRIIRLCVLILLVTLPSLAQATVYYVATTGNDTTGNGSSGSPWRTIQKCANTAVNGDTCSVNDGTYTVASTSNFVVISTSGVTYKSTNKLGAKISGNSYVTAVGFNVNSANNITIQDFEIYGFYTAINANGTTASSGLTVRGNLIHDIGATCNNSGSGFVGVFTKTGTTSLTVEKNIFHTIGRYQTGQNGCALTGGGQTGQNDHAIYTGGGTGFTIRENLFYNVIVGWPIHMYPNAHTNVTIVNNTFSDAAYSVVKGHIRFAASITTGNISNNISYAPTGGFLHGTTGTFSGVNVRNNLISNTASLWYSSTPSGTTNTGTITNTNPLFTNVGTRDYTLTGTSPAIDAGIDVSLPYNGTARDLGVYETFKFATCSVANTSPTVINVTFTNNNSPPLLPASSITGFSARADTVAKTVSSVSRTGDNQVNITVSAAFTGGQAIDITYSGGNLTDSAYIGGSGVQTYVQTLSQQSCTNNVSGAPSHLFIQAKFEWHGLRGTEAAPVVLPYSAAAEDTNINVVVGGKARLRLAVTCTTADCPPTGFYLYYSKDGGAYAVVPDTFGADNIAFCGTNPDPDIPSSGAATTDQLSTAGTFVPAALVRTSNAIPTIDLAQNNKTEPEYCLAWDTDTTADATYDFRIRKQDGTVIDTYTVTPRATVRAQSAGMGF